MNLKQFGYDKIYRNAEYGFKKLLADAGYSFVNGSQPILENPLIYGIKWTFLERENSVVLKIK